MIPKIVHYCWFGPAEYPEKVKYCINSWQKKLAGYTFKLWNEDTFDLNECTFVKEAYAHKKYAFVSDYVRLWALKKYGGIYLDTDIEVLKSFDSLLNLHTILGTDDVGKLTSFMATEPDTPFFEEMVAFYKDLHFELPDGSLNTVVNNEWMQNVLAKYGYLMEDKNQLLDGNITLFPSEYFHVKSLVSGKVNLTKNSYCIHHHTLLWVPRKTKILRFLRLKVFVPLLGEKRYLQIVNTIKKVSND